MTEVFIALATHIPAKKGTKEYTLAPLLKPHVIIYLLFVVYEQIVASCRNTVNKMQNQRYYFIPVYQKCQIDLVVGDKTLYAHYRIRAHICPISPITSRHSYILMLSKVIEPYL